MSKRSQSDLEQARSVAHQIAERIKNSPAYKQQVQDNPVAMLQSEGLHESAVPEFMNQIGIQSDVQGYDQGCGPFALTCDWTCLITKWPGAAQGAF